MTGEGVSFASYPLAIVVCADASGELADKLRGFEKIVIHGGARVHGAGYGPRDREAERRRQ
jgi:hypothetical protein